MNIIKYLLLLFLMNFNLYSFDSIEILNPNINLHKSGYFKTNKDLTPQEVLKENFMPLPQKAVSFGFDHSTYWFLFEVSTSINEQIYLDSKSIVSDYQTLYIFENNKLLKESFNGYFIPIKNREIKTFPIRFQLETNQNKITYLLKLTSKSPIYCSFSLGTSNEIDKMWNWFYLIIIFTVSTSFAFIIYNLFLYFITKDKAYIFYCIYIIGFLGLNVIGLGYLPLLSFLNVQDAYYYFLISVLIKIIGLTFFAIYFLQLKEQQPKLQKIFLFLLIITIILGGLYAFRIAQPIFAISVQLIMLFSIFIGIKCYLSNYKAAIFYLVATGMGNALFLGFMLMNQGNGVNYSLLTLNLSNVALVWDLIMFSLALAYRIKILQEKNETNQKLALIKSKQSSLGEISGNIAHQWRQPLAELGSINTNIEAKLKFSEISKKELLEKLEINKNILNHLSQTINTFQSFFQNSNIETKFCVNDEIKRCIDFVNDSMKNNQISIKFSSDNNYFLQGNANEFSQIILNIILNAKDALCERNIENRTIFIKINSFKSEFKIEISDNAGGIKIEPIESIFESYITSKDKGIGIGLFIVKTLVEEKFKGNIFISNGEFGAIFEITLKKLILKNLK